MGDQSKAKGFYTKSIEANPFEVEALYNLANLNCEEGNYNEAISLYLRTIA